MSNALPSGIRIGQTDDGSSAVSFEIDRTGCLVPFDLTEAAALEVALAILGVSISIRDAAGGRWRPRLAGTTTSPRARACVVTQGWCFIEEQRIWSRIREAIVQIRGAPSKAEH